MFNIHATSSSNSQNNYIKKKERRELYNRATSYKPKFTAVNDTDLSLEYTISLWLCNLIVVDCIADKRHRHPRQRTKKQRKRDVFFIESASVRFE